MPCNDGIDFGRCYARCNDLGDKLVRLPNADASLPHERDFTFRFKLYHGQGSPPYDERKATDSL